MHVSPSDVAAARADGADFGYAGCSKRPASRVLRELDEKGLVSERLLWRRIERLVQLTAIAMAPELALRYRARFPCAWPSESAAEAARTDGRPRRYDRSHCAFHVVGMDVLIDAHGCPRLLEVNSKPSQSVDVEGTEGPERSPVDLEVKRRIMSDMLLHVAGGGRAPLLRAVLGGDARQVAPPPPSTELLDRVRRVFEVLTRRSAAASAPSFTLTPATPTGGAEPDINNGRWTTFARSAGLYSLAAGSDVQQAFLRNCRQQAESRAIAHRSYQFADASRPTPSGHTARAAGDFQPRDAQTRMRFPAFARALSDVADVAFAGLHAPFPAGGLHAPFPAGVSARAARLQQLLDHIAHGGVPSPSTGAPVPAAVEGSSLRLPPQNGELSQPGPRPPPTVAQLLPKPLAEASLEPSPLELPIESPPAIAPLKLSPPLPAPAAAAPRAKLPLPLRSRSRPTTAHLVSMKPRLVAYAPGLVPAPGYLPLNHPYLQQLANQRRHKPAWVD